MKVRELFDVKYGINLELNACEITEGIAGINFVARTAENNGVVAKVKPISGQKPQPAGVLTCAAGGSVLSTFVQPQPFYSGRDLYILTPKQEMSLEEKLFYCHAIKMNAYRYQYGRQANRTLKNINLPILPSWLKGYKINFKRIQTQNKSSIYIHTNSWKSYKIGHLFDVVRGTRLTKENRVAGHTPLVTAGAQNEGVSDFIQANKRPLYKDVLTIDMFCNCFYHEYSFSCDDNILVLSPQFKQNKFNALFIATVVNQEKNKYAYGRQYRQKDFNNHLLKLPSKKINGKYEPDWQYMENYIKNLPYGDLI